MFSISSSSSKSVTEMVSSRLSPFIPVSLILSPIRVVVSDASVLAARRISISSPSAVVPFCTVSFLSLVAPSFADT